MAQTVAILGGGVAGMSAAHELAERGFQVHVYERQPEIPGGKARSVPVPDSATGGRRPLPGEHGFRFFPGFYRHVTDTMRRIPYGNNRRGVLDNLVPSTKVMLARSGHTPIITLTRFPRTFSELRTLLDTVLHADAGFWPGEVDFFAARVWQLMTSCRERRREDYEKLPWWQYVQGEHRSPAYQELFAKGLTRTLVAARAEEASTKTGGDIFIQLLFNMSNPRIVADRVLDGPTNDVWLDPWLRHLQAMGVQYHFNTRVLHLDCADGRLTGARVQHGDDPPEQIVADHYLAAVPIEQMAPLLNEDILRADPTLRSLLALAPDVAWMTGIQFYLNEPVVINHGHVIYADAPWALTSISQLPFWRNFDVSQYGDGTVKSILSIDISDWDAPGLNGRAARACTPEEIKDEVWAQLKKCLAEDHDLHLHDDMIVAWYLDRDITYDGDGAPAEGPAPLPSPTLLFRRLQFKTHNEEPLLVNKINTWMLRPEAVTGIPNLFLAADYVRTYTDLATMEGANEAARRAVNGLLDASGADAPLCKLWDLHEPWVLFPLRWLDRRRFRRGLPWRDEAPWIFKVAHFLFAVLHRLVARTAPARAVPTPHPVERPVRPLTPA